MTAAIAAVMVGACISTVHAMPEKMQTVADVCPETVVYVYRKDPALTGRVPEVYGPMQPVPVAFNQQAVTDKQPAVKKKTVKKRKARKHRHRRR